MIVNTRVFKPNESEGEFVQVLCVDCKRPTKHRIVGSLDEHAEQFDQQEGWAVEAINRFQIVQCQGCEETTFRHTTWFSEDDWHGSDPTTVRLYPARTASSLGAKPFPNIPATLRRIYSESVDCYNNESATLCAAGLRALLEGLCAAEGVLDGTVVSVDAAGHTTSRQRDNLEGKISGLHEKGLLTAAQASSLHAHRYLGNDAVHELARPADDELRLAIEILEHMLEQMYELPRKAEALATARAGRKKP